MCVDLARSVLCPPTDLSRAPADLVIRAFYVAGDALDGLYARLGVPGLMAAELLTGIGPSSACASAFAAPADTAYVTQARPPG